MNRSAKAIAAILLSLPARGAPLLIKPLFYGMGQAFVACALDGHAQQCFVDTGSSFSTVAAEGPFSAYPPMERAKSSGLFGAEEEESVITLGSIEVDGKTRTGVKVTRAMDRGRYPLPLLGMDVLGGDTLSLDFQAKKLWIGPSPEEHAEAFTQTFPLQLARGGLPMIPSAIGGAASLAIVDTGTEMTVVDKKLVRRRPAWFAGVERSEISITDTTGTRAPTRLLWLKSLKVGPVSLRGMWVVAADLRPLRKSIREDAAIILGFNALAQKNWFFDFKRRRFGVSDFRRDLAPEP